MQFIDGKFLDQPPFEQKEGTPQKYQIYFAKVFVDVDERSEKE